MLLVYIYFQDHLFVTRQLIDMFVPGEGHLFCSQLSSSAYSSLNGVGASGGYPLWLACLLVTFLFSSCLGGRVGESLCGY